MKRPPEAISSRALFPTAPIPGHARRRVRIPNERQLVRGRTGSADRSVLFGFLLWLGFLLVQWGFDVGKGEEVPGWLRLAALPLCIAVVWLVEVLLLRGDRGRARWARWARARGLRPFHPRALRGASLEILRSAQTVPVLFVGNVGGYRLAVGAACRVDPDPHASPQARFSTFVYATLPAHAAQRVPRLVTGPRGLGAAATPVGGPGMHPAPVAPAGRDVLVQDGADDAAAGALLRSGITDLLREQPNIGIEQDGVHLVVWAPSSGSWAHRLRHYADPDLEPTLVDALCDIAVHIVRRYVGAPA